MVGETHQIAIGDDDLLPPWPTLYEITAAIDPRSWALVGGLMVQVHAYRAKMPPPRPTRDIDILVDLPAGAGDLPTIGFNRVGISELASN